MITSFWTKSVRLVGAVAVLTALLAGCNAHRAGSGAAVSQTAAATTLVRPPVEPEPDWRGYFRDISRGAILVSIDARTLHYWSPGAAAYSSYPIAVPRQADFTRTGSTSIVRKRERPDWRPTPAMRKRDPRLPAYVGPGPGNPLGLHAMYLGWQYYRIHGTNNPASIGRAATSGCFRLFPADIEELFGKTGVGTPVKVVQRVDQNT